MEFRSRRKPPCASRRLFRAVGNAGALPHLLRILFFDSRRKKEVPPTGVPSPKGGRTYSSRKNPERKEFSLQQHRGSSLPFSPHTFAGGAWLACLQSRTQRPRSHPSAMLLSPSTRPKACFRFLVARFGPATTSRSGRPAGSDHFHQTFLIARRVLVRRTRRCNGGPAPFLNRGNPRQIFCRPLKHRQKKRSKPLRPRKRRSLPPISVSGPPPPPCRAIDNYTVVFVYLGPIPLRTG